MLTDLRAGVAVSVLVALAILAYSSAGADAATREKPRKHIFDDLVTPSMQAPPAIQTRPQATTARFFSINGVLAKLDGKPNVESPVRVASAVDTDVASDAPAIISSATANSTEEPFGLFAFRAPEGVLWRKWRAVMRDIKNDLKEVARCRDDRSTCNPAAARFVLMMDDIRGHDGRAQMETVNRLVNGAIHYTSDLVQHGTVDVSSAPLASFASGRGDCEDYAIAKYALLREAGIPESDLRVLLVRDRSIREDHAVLAVRNAGAWVVLDNRYSAITPDSELRHFTPLYALNGGGVSLFATPYLTQRLNIDWSTVAPASDGMDVMEEPNTETTAREPQPPASFVLNDTPSSPGFSFGAGSLPILM